MCHFTRMYCSPMLTVHCTAAIAEHWQHVRGCGTASVIPGTKISYAFLFRNLTSKSAPCTGCRTYLQQYRLSVPAHGSVMHLAVAVGDVLSLAASIVRGLTFFRSVAAFLLHDHSTLARTLVLELGCSCVGIFRLMPCHEYAVEQLLLA